MPALGRLRWALAWAILILVLCLMPGAALPAWHWADLFSVDKLVHAGLFAVLAWLLLKGLTRPDEVLALRATGVVLLACIAYGGALELMQMLPALGRRGDWNDFTANAIGAVAGSGWHRWRAGRMRSAQTPADA